MWRNDRKSEKKAKYLAMKEKLRAERERMTYDRAEKWHEYEKIRKARG